MKAPNFQYARAHSVSHVLDLLAQYGDDALILAGGQSLMPLLNMRMAKPAILVDINPLRDLGRVRVGDGVLHIGAMTRHRDVAESPLVREHCPLLTEAMRHVAHPAIRNRGTFGGSLATADPSAEMPACCLALQATMLVESRRGRRAIAAQDFFRGIFETALEPDELLVGVDIPLSDSGWRPAFIEIARRHGDYAIGGIATQARLEQGRIVDLRLVLFGIEAHPRRIRTAEQAILTARSIDRGIADAQATLSRELAPLSDSQAGAELRLHYARILVKRVVLALTAGEEAPQ
jgi:carbon-monoxide dehydrogenase medium subunit